MSYCPGHFATRWFLLWWNAAVVQVCSCQSHNLCGFRADSGKQSVEKREVTQTSQNTTSCSSQTKSASVFRGFPGSQLLSLHPASVAGHGQNNAKYRLLCVCINTPCYTAIQVNIFLTNLKKKKKNCYQQNQQVSVLLEVFWNFRCLCVFEEGGLEEVIYIKKMLYLKMTHSKNEKWQCFGQNWSE